MPNALHDACVSLGAEKTRSQLRISVDSEEETAEADAVLRSLKRRAQAAPTTGFDGRRCKPRVQHDAVSAAATAVTCATAFESFASGNIDDTQTFLLRVFCLLTVDGDGRRVFVFRGVSKAFRTSVDAMSTRQWGALFASTVQEPALGRFLQERCPSLVWAHAEASAAVERDTRAAFRAVLQGRERTPGLFLLLQLCQQMAIDAACKPRRFASVFDNELRGFVYYAVFTEARVLRVHVLRGARPEALVGELHKWWPHAIAQARQSVERRLAHRPSKEREAARASLRNFVHTMAAIAFHGCRQTDAFRDAGVRELEAAAAREQ